MKYASKRALLDDIKAEHAAFVECLDGIPSRQRTAPGVWGDDWTVKDLVLHLTEWEQMFLGWYRAGRDGATVHLPAEGYKWNQTAQLNRDIRRRTHRTSWRRARAAFDESYEEILAVAQDLSDHDLMTPGVFPWTRKNPLISYLSANTASHYRTARKILTRWTKRSR